MNSSTNSESFQYSGFSAPISRKKRKGKQSTRPPLFTLVDQCRESLMENDWYGQCEEILIDLIPFNTNEPFEIICLGLGSPSLSPISRAQYSFLLNLCNSSRLCVRFLVSVNSSWRPLLATGMGGPLAHICSKKPSNISLYDPVFSDEDCGLFEVHGLSVSSAFTNGAVIEEDTAKPTIYFMPHCDVDLYEQVLKANWSENRIRNLVLIGNRLEDYVERELKVKAPHILRIVPTLTSKPLPLCQPWPAAFNNTAVQCLSPGADWSRDDPTSG
ncbi:hypothetical protein L218DRAFT_200346 [Marasmius fiardii PR-910]|nr:hypothetical protein L218DRAFT_200346 [Marasmius fiardii PR-910]